MDTCVRLSLRRRCAVSIGDTAKRSARGAAVRVFARLRQGWRALRRSMDHGMDAVSRASQGWRSARGATVRVFAGGLLDYKEKTTFSKRLLPPQYAKCFSIQI